MLNGGGADETKPGTAASPSGAMRNADNANACSRGSSENTFLLPRIDSLIVSSRFAGSSTSVARLHRMLPTMLPPLSASSAVRRLTGTIATSGASGSACSIQQVVAQRTGAHREDDVVDGHAGGLLDGFDPVQRPRLRGARAARRRSAR